MRNEQSRSRGTGFARHTSSPHGHCDCRMRLHHEEVPESSPIDIARAVGAVDRAIDRMAEKDDGWQKAFERARAAWRRHVGEAA
jgi:hypothetical protein